MAFKTRQTVRFAAASALSAACLLLVLPQVAQSQEPAAEAGPVIGPGRVVLLEYTTRLDDGTVIESTLGGTPMRYEHGAGMVIPALEAEFEGLAKGDTKKFSLDPEQTQWGPPDSELVFTVPADQIPKELRQVGAVLNARVREVKGDEVVLDYNHPLAGQNLTYEIRVLEVQ